MIGDISKLEKRRIQFGSLLFAFSLLFVIRFNQIFEYDSAQVVQGENIPGFEIPVVITALFLLTSILVIRRRE